MSDVKRVVIHGVERTLDWRKDPPDHRDYYYEDPKFRVMAPVKVPDAVNLTKYESPIKDQGQEGSCTGFGISGLMEFKYWNANPPQKLIFSPLFIYYNERFEEGDVTEDNGANIRTGMRTLAKYGVCQESLWPYTDSHDQMIKQPSKEAYTDAANYTTRNYYRITSLNGMINCLAQGHPFTCGIMVYESFQSDEVARTGMVPMPSTTEQPLGGHCIDAVGYSKAHKLFIMRNSWGLGWGVKGHFFLPFAYLSDSGLASDMWTIRG